MRPPESRQRGVIATPKVADDRFRFGKHGIYRGGKFKTHMPKWAPGVAHAYHKGTAELVCHVRRRTLKEQREDLCAVYYGAGMKLKVPALSNLKPLDILQGSLVRLGRGHIQQTVLVRIIEIAEGRQDGREVWAESVVRLYPLDSCPHITRERVQATTALSLKLLGGVGNWEHQQSVAPGRESSIAGNDGELVDHVIQRGANVVDCVSGNQSHARQFRPPENLDVNADDGCISVSLLGESIRCWLSPGRDFRFEGFEVFFCPRDLTVSVQ